MKQGEVIGRVGKTGNVKKPPNHIYFEVAKLQYPEEMKRIGAFLVKLVSDGKMRQKISGGELLSLLRQLGLKIHLETQIRFMEHGKLETLAERIKETE